MMPPCDQTGTPGDVGFTHFHSSTISGSASWMILRTFASICPRQSLSSWILASNTAEAASVGTFSFISLQSRTYFGDAQFELQPTVSTAVLRLMDPLPDNILVVATIDQRVHLPFGIMEDLPSFDAFSEEDVTCFGNKLNPRRRPSCEIKLAFSVGHDFALACEIVGADVVVELS